MNWPRLSALARRHGVTALLVRSLDVLGQDSVPAQVREEMQRYARLVRVNALAQSAELLALLDAFAGAGISARDLHGKRFMLIVVPRAILSFAFQRRQAARTLASG